MRGGLEDRYEDDSRYVSVGAAEDGRSRFDRWEKVAGWRATWLACWRMERRNFLSFSRKAWWGRGEENNIVGRENFEGDELRGQISMSNEERLFSSAFYSWCEWFSIYLKFFFLRQWWNNEIAQVRKISFREFQIFTTQFSSESLIYRLWWCNNKTNLIDTETLIIYIYYNNIANFKERMLAVFSSRLIVKLIE